MAQIQARVRANNKYNIKTYSQVAFRYRKGDPVFETLEKLCQDSRKCSKAAYIRKALITQYKADGIECVAISKEPEEAAQKGAQAVQSAQKRPKALPFTPMTEDDEAAFEQMAQQEAKKQREDKRKSGAAHI